MSHENKHNLFYVESSSMKGLYETLEEWQNANGKRLLSVSVQKDKGKFCCIALSNPSEVVITDTLGRESVYVNDGRLAVKTYAETLRG